MLEREEKRKTNPCAVCGQGSDFTIWGQRLCGPCAAVHHEDPRFTTGSVLATGIPDEPKPVAAEFERRTKAWVAERKRQRSGLAVVEVRP